VRFKCARAQRMRLTCWPISRLAGQLARDRNADYVVLQSARAQSPIAMAQAQLCSPGDRADLAGWPSCRICNWHAHCVPGSGNSTPLRPGCGGRDWLPGLGDRLLVDDSSRWSAPKAPVRDSPSGVGGGQSVSKSPSSATTVVAPIRSSPRSVISTPHHRLHPPALDLLAQ